MVCTVQTLTLNVLYAGMWEFWCRLIMFIIKIFTCTFTLSFNIYINSLLKPKLFQTRIFSSVVCLGELSVLLSKRHSHKISHCSLLPKKKAKGIYCFHRKISLFSGFIFKHIIYQFGTWRVMNVFYVSQLSGIFGVEALEGKGWAALASKLTLGKPMLGIHRILNMVLFNFFLDYTSSITWISPTISCHVGLIHFPIQVFFSDPHRNKRRKTNWDARH